MAGSFLLSRQIMKISVLIVVSRKSRTFAGIIIPGIFDWIPLTSTICKGFSAITHAKIAM